MVDFADTSREAYQQSMPHDLCSEPRIVTFVARLKIARSFSHQKGSFQHEKSTPLLDMFRPQRCYSQSIFKLDALIQDTFQVCNNNEATFEALNAKASYLAIQVGVLAKLKPIASDEDAKGSAHESQ